MKTEILLIEDNKLISFIIKKLTEEFNKDAKVIEFEDGEKALDYILKLDSSICNLPNLILLDINLPILNGWQLLERLESVKHPILSVPIFITSSSEDLNNVEKARNCAYINGYLKKPIMHDKYFSLLECYLDASV